MNGQHEFRLTNCVEDAVEYPAWYATNLGHGTHMTALPSMIFKAMICHLCGQRMKGAAAVCPGRKPDAPKG